MKRLFLFLAVAMVSVVAANAQKFALVDMEYILKNVPAYERANEQLNQISKKWEGEVEALLTEAENLFKKYQSESVFLSDAQKTKSEEAIMNKEKEASDLKKKYFGSEGELFKKRQSLTVTVYYDGIEKGKLTITENDVDHVLLKTIHAARRLLPSLTLPPAFISSRLP